MFPELVEYCYYKYHNSDTEEYRVIKAEKSIPKNTVASLFCVDEEKLKNTSSDEYKKYIKNRENNK